MDQVFTYVDSDPIAVVRGGVAGDKLLGIGSNPGLGKAIKLTKGTLEPVLSTTGREIMYIAGPSGSGKSQFAATLIRNHLRADPEASVIAFVRGTLDDDPAWEESKESMSQVEISEDFLAQTPDITLLPENSILLFDDVLSLPDEKLRKMVQRLAIDAMEVGRKRRIHIILTSHLISPTDIRLGRVVLNEMTSLVVFPGQGGSHQIRAAAKKYLSMDTSEVNRVLFAKSRWVLIHARSPRYCLTQGEGWLL